MRYVTVCLNPAIQMTLVLPALVIDEVNRARASHADPGGKGIHVSRVLGQLGESVTHITQVGGRTGDWFMSMAGGEAFELSRVDSGVDVRLCYTLVAGSSVTEIAEEGHAVDARVDTAVRDRYRERLEGADCVVISGSRAPGFADDIFPWMVRECAARGKAVMVDYRGRDLTGSLSQGVTIAKPNLREFSETFLGVTVRGDGREPELMAAVREQLVERSREFRCLFVITDGPNPVLVCDGERVEEYPVQSIRAVNPIGSGDAFGAGFVSRYLATHDIRSAVEEGVRCAGANATLLRPGRIR